jgi:hypothetical protein
VRLFRWYGKTVWSVAVGGVLLLSHAVAKWEEVEVTLYTCSRYLPRYIWGPGFERVNKRSTAKQYVGLSFVLRLVRLRVRC